MNKNIQFATEGHSYQRVSDGKLLPGVTTIIASKDKGFLLNWAVKLCADFVLDKWKAGIAYEKPAIEEIVATAKKEHTRVSTEGKNVGTATHSWIENFLKGREDPITPDIEKPVSAFKRWYEATKPKVLHQEGVCGITSDDEINYAGKFDLIAEIDGKTVLIDFKTSTGFYSEAFLQLAAYQYALEKESGIKIDYRMLVRVAKDGVCESLVVPTPYDLDLGAFKALLTATRFDSYLNNHFTKKYGIIQYKDVVTY